MGISSRAEIGRRIRSLRIERGMSQVVLADHSQLSRVNYSRIERGKADVKVSTLARIAKALGVRLAELLRDVD